MPRQFLYTLASVCLLPILSQARTIDGYDAGAIETALKGKTIVVQNGCLEEPRLNEGIAKIYKYQFHDAPEDDSTFRRTVTNAFFEGLAKKAMNQVTGANEQSIGSRIAFGIYDTQERLLVYYDDAKAAALDDYLVIKVIAPEHWEAAARKLGEKIGAKIAKLPGR